MKNLILSAVSMILISLPALAQSDDPAIDPLALIGNANPPEDPAPDKSMYLLFDPVPDDQMRAFSTDRPGKTHSSTTVDAGHFQVESDFLNYTYDHTSPSSQTTRSLSVATPIFKAGISSNLDIEAAFDFYNDTHVTSRVTGAPMASVGGTGPGGSSGVNSASTGPTTASTVKGQGFGDIALGSKINIFGNDGGSQSLALLPFVKLPTAAQYSGNGVIEYTLNVPYTIDLDTLWSLTLEPTLGFLKNASNTGHHGDYGFLANINRPVGFKNVTAALELASDYSSDRNIGPRYTIDPSLQWVVVPNVQLDIGAYVGLNRAAPDLNPYIGISYRY